MTHRQKDDGGGDIRYRVQICGCEPQCKSITVDATHLLSGEIMGPVVLISPEAARDVAGFLVEAAAEVDRQAVPQ